MRQRARPLYRFLWFVFIAERGGDFVDIPIPIDQRLGCPILAKQGWGTDRPGDGPTILSFPHPSPVAKDGAPTAPSLDYLKARRSDSRPTVSGLQAFCCTGQTPASKGPGRAPLDKIQGT